MEKNTKMLGAALFLILGLAVGYWLGADRYDNVGSGAHMMPGGGMMYGSGMEDVMVGMMSGLSNLSGDAFDRAFLAQMIMHHEGAVAMAEAALRDAKHEEIKTMARDIISAQTREIEQMQAWQKDWYNQ